MKNRGKIFEDNFKASTPKDILCERFKDAGYSYGKNRDENGNGDSISRFTPHNVSDFFLFDGSILIYTELKSTKGKSLSLKQIREKQPIELVKRQSYKNVIAGFVIEFQDLERVFWLNIADFMQFTQDSTRKSIPFDFFLDHGIEVEVKKLRTNYRYNVNKLFEDIINTDL